MAARGIDQASLDERIAFIVRTLPPLTLLNFALVAWFADASALLFILAGAFMVNIAVARPIARRYASAATASVMINLAIFTVAALIGGTAAPGWLFFFVPVVATVINFVGDRSRLALLGVTNVACLGSNIAVVRDPSLTAAVTLLLGGLSVLLYRVSKHLEHQQAQIEAERTRSDALLALLMPQHIANRIKAGETEVADRYDSVTILFADIVGFTPLSERMAPEQLVQTLDAMFTTFDDRVEELGVEKIKTIGDSYMVASGLDGSIDDPAAVVELGLSMIDALVAFNTAHGTSFRLRVGVNRGPVVAGVVGVRRFVYDVWGDTVNTAARMESHGVPGRVQATSAVRDAIGSTFEAESRGPIEVKGKGSMEVWLLGRPMRS